VLFRFFFFFFFLNVYFHVVFPDPNTARIETITITR